MTFYKRRETLGREYVLCLFSETEDVTAADGLLLSRTKGRTEGSRLEGNTDTLHLAIWTESALTRAGPTPADLHTTLLHGKNTTVIRTFTATWPQTHR